MATLTWVDAGENGTWLAVREVYRRYSQPVQDVLYYPVHRATRREAEDIYPLGSQLRESIGECYEYTTETGQTIYVQLLHGGKTLPVSQEEHPISCPKVRIGIETRWFDGRWQKWSKRKGWVPA